jgi:hypothetical protein
MTRTILLQTFALSTVSAAIALGCGSSGNTGSGGAGGQSTSNGGGSTHTGAHGPGSTGTQGNGGAGTGGMSSTTSASAAGGNGGASVSASVSASASSTGAGGMMSPGDSVLTHHKNASRDGMYVEPALTKAAVATLHVDASFAPSLTDTGSIYAQPLFVDGGGTAPDLVIIATENNNVFALDGADGHVAWTKNVGMPTPQNQLGCGNLGTYGITGTPVIDWASRRIFLDAHMLKGGLPTHQIFALSIDTGDVANGYPIDVPATITGNVGFDASVQGQRGALAIAAGTLFVAYGGLYGDCGTYHGWIVGVELSDPTHFEAWPTGARGGGVWSMGGVSADDTNVYMATGNTFGATNWGGGEGMLKFPVGSPLTGGPADYFAPKNWKSLDNADLDLGTAPIPFDLAGSSPSHLAISFGKDGNAYLVDRTALGGVSNAIGGPGNCSMTNSCQSLHVASNQVISAPVLYTTATATYVAFKGTGSTCTGGTSGSLTAITVTAGSPPSLAHSWCASAGTGTPMVTTSDGHADAIVWQTGAESDNHLHAFDGDSGAAIPFTASGTTISTARYNAPIAAKGRIFVAAKDSGGHATVVALKP